jgi:hypothetical protein
MNPCVDCTFMSHGANAVVDVLDTGVAELELRLLERPGEPLVLAAQPLRVDEHPQPLVEGQLLHLGVLLLLGPGDRQGIEPQQPELLHRRFRQHVVSLQVS